MKKYIYGAANVIWYAYIYGFSADTGTDSAAKSRVIAEFFERIFSSLTSTFLQYDKSLFIEVLALIIRKCAHMTEFMILAMLLELLVISIGGSFRKFLPFVFTVLYAAADEFHQAFVPGRGPAMSDVLIDSIGASIGIAWMYLYFKKIWENRSELNEI